MVKKYTFFISFQVGTVLINRSSLSNYHLTLNDLFEEELVRNKKIRTIMFSSLDKICISAYICSIMMITMILTYFMPSYLFIIRNLCHFYLTNYTLLISRGYRHFWTIPDNFLYHFYLLFKALAASISSIITRIYINSVFDFYNVYQFASTMHATFRLTNLLTEKFSDILKAKNQTLLQCRNTLEHIYGTIVFWHNVTNVMLLSAYMMSVRRYMH